MENLQPHQQRILNEKAELDEKLDKLSQFIEGSPVYATLSTDERILLKKQEYYMSEYSEILGRRISNF